MYNQSMEINRKTADAWISYWENYIGNYALPTWEQIPDFGLYNAKDMAAELGHGNKIPQVLPKLAQYELTLLDWIEGHKG